MDYKETIKYLCGKFGVKEEEIVESLRNPKIFGNGNLFDLEFKLTEENHNMYVHACGGRIPLALYLIEFEGENAEKKRAMIYNHKFILNNKEITMVETSPPKDKNIEVVGGNSWDTSEHNYGFGNIERKRT
jgi:hypothetical protein